MAVLAFTDRELQRAWRNNLAASLANHKTNAHRLLLFYAVECGLKAVILKREGKARTDLLSKNIKEYGGHDINKLLIELNSSSELHLQVTKMKQLEKPTTARDVPVGDFNQMWRYGGSSDSTISDNEIENKLNKIIEWIEQEIKS